MRSIKIIALLSLVWSIVSCVDNNLQDGRPVVGSGAPMQIYASSEDEMSRTSVQDDKYEHLSEGDAIAYFPRTTSNVQYQLQSTTPTQEGYCIFKRVPESVEQGSALSNIYAVYPYAQEVAINSEGNISLQLPEVQYYAENSFGVGAAPMVAVSNGAETEPLHFKHVSGFLKLQMYGKDFVVKRVELRGNNNEKLAGAATIVAETGSAPKISAINSTTERVVLDCGNGVQLGADASKATAFWFALPEVEFSEGFTITIYGADNTSYIKSTSKSYTIERNTIQPMKIFDVVNDANIDIRDEDGTVHFYLLERSNGVRSIIGATEHNWKECTVLVNDKTYEVEFDGQNRPYVRVEYSTSGSYRAALLPSGSEKWYHNSPYEDVLLPCSQFDSSAKSAIRSFPMYAT